MIHTAKTISQQLAQRAEEVAIYLLPNGKRVGNEWCCGSIDGEAGKSLKVCIAGDKAGVFSDFADNAVGDLLTLWSLNRSCTLFQAMRQASQWLGLGRAEFEPKTHSNHQKPKVVLKATSPNSPVMDYLINERKLTSETIAAFKIGEQGRNIVFPYLRQKELIFVKYLGLDRPESKKQIRTEADCQPCLFGWDVIPPDARNVTICEGEIDSMTLNQYGIHALSVPFGGGSGGKHKWLEYEFDRLAVFDEIFLCFDNDDAGKVAVAELAERLGCYRCRIVELPHKDANACLQAGVSREEIQTAFQQASTLDPEELKRASSFVENVIGEFYPIDGIPLGINPPWEKARSKILFRPDELSIWTGINGSGKSQFLGQIILHSMKSNARVCIASLELKPKRLLMRMTRQAAGLANPSEEYIRAIHEWYGENLWLFDLTGTAKAKRLLEVFQYARQRYGVDVFVIDSMLRLDLAEDDYKNQKAFIEQLCDFKNKHSCHIHLIVHPRKGADESNIPGKLDIKGSGAISDLADNCFAIWRNKGKEEIKRLQSQGKPLDIGQLDKLEMPDCLWICDKQRNGDWEGKISLWFDPASFQYLNYSGQKPIQYVSFSNPISKTRQMSV
jgi:twinkle protein